MKLKNYLGAVEVVMNKLLSLASKGKINFNKIKIEEINQIKLSR